MGFESSTPLEQFDELFERIDNFATPVPDGQSERPNQTATRATESLGKLSFMLFESETRSESDENKLLYSPSITAYSGKPGHYKHIKRNQLEIKPTSQDERKKLIELVENLDTIENWFTRYEQLRD